MHEVQSDPKTTLNNQDGNKKVNPNTQTTLSDSFVDQSQIRASNDLGIQPSWRTSRDLPSSNLITSFLTEFPAGYLSSAKEQEKIKIPVPEIDARLDYLGQTQTITPENDPKVKYIQSIVDKLLTVARSNYSFTYPALRVILLERGASPDGNVMPDGTICLNWQLLNYCGSEDEIAAVLAHEILHLVNRTYVEKQQGDSAYLKNFAVPAWHEILSDETSTLLSLAGYNTTAGRELHRTFGQNDGQGRGLVHLGSRNRVVQNMASHKAIDTHTSGQNFQPKPEILNNLQILPTNLEVALHWIQKDNPNLTKFAEAVQILVPEDFLEVQETISKIDGPIQVQLFSIVWKILESDLKKLGYSDQDISHILLQTNPGTFICENYVEKLNIHNISLVQRKLANFSTFQQFLDSYFSLRKKEVLTNTPSEIENKITLTTNEGGNLDFLTCLISFQKAKNGKDLLEMSDSLYKEIYARKISFKSQEIFNAELIKNYYQNKFRMTLPRERYLRAGSKAYQDRETLVEKITVQITQEIAETVMLFQKSSQKIKWDYRIEAIDIKILYGQLYVKSFEENLKELIDGKPLDFNQAKKQLLETKNLDEFRRAFVTFLEFYKIENFSETLINEIIESIEKQSKTKLTNKAICKVMVALKMMPDPDPQRKYVANILSSTDPEIIKEQEFRDCSSLNLTRKNILALGYGHSNQSVVSYDKAIVQIDLETLDTHPLFQYLNQDFFESKNTPKILCLEDILSKYYELKFDLEKDFRNSIYGDNRPFSQNPTDILKWHTFRHELWNSIEAFDLTVESIPSLMSILVADSIWLDMTQITSFRNRLADTFIQSKEVSLEDKADFIYKFHEKIDPEICTKIGEQITNYADYLRIYNRHDLKAELLTGKKSSILAADAVASEVLRVLENSAKIETLVSAIDSNNPEKFTNELAKIWLRTLSKDEYNETNNRMLVDAKPYKSFSDFVGLLQGLNSTQKQIFILKLIEGVDFSRPGEKASLLKAISIITDSKEGVVNDITSAILSTSKQELILLLVSAALQNRLFAYTNIADCQPEKLLPEYLEYSRLVTNDPAKLEELVNSSEPELNQYFYEKANGVLKTEAEKTSETYLLVVQDIESKIAKLEPAKTKNSEVSSQESVDKPPNSYDSLINALEVSGAITVRLLQLASQMLPQIQDPQLRARLNSSQDSNAGIEHLNMWNILRYWLDEEKAMPAEQLRELLDFVNKVSIGEKIGGGSLNTAFAGEMVDSEGKNIPIVIKVLSPNAASFIKESYQVLDEACDNLINTRGQRELGENLKWLANLSQSWCLKDINDSTYMEDDQRFQRELANIQLTTGYQVKFTKTLLHLPKFKSEERAAGDTANKFMSNASSSQTEKQEVLTSTKEIFEFQLFNRNTGDSDYQLFWSDPHLGNLIKHEKSLSIIDRHLYLKIPKWSLPIFQSLYNQTQTGNVDSEIYGEATSPLDMLIQGVLYHNKVRGLNKKTTEFRLKAMLATELKLKPLLKGNFGQPDQLSTLRTIITSMNKLKLDVPLEWQLMIRNVTMIQGLNDKYAEV